MVTVEEGCQEGAREEGDVDEVGEEGSGVKSFKKWLQA